MLFGLCNAAAAFQRLMQTALIGLFSKHCIIYLDDILVFRGDIQEHNANLKLVSDRLRDAGLTLNPKRCRFLQLSVTFLGHTVWSNGIAVTDDRVQQVRTWPTPTNQTELRSFLGLANYYLRFVKGFATIASPLHKLTEKQAKKNFKWEKEHDEAFKEMKRMLCSVPILALPNFDSSAPPFMLYTDASDAAVGGVLSQKDIKAENKSSPTQVERTNRALIGLLKAFTKDAQPDDWDLSLGRVLLAYRATVHTSTGVSPFKMLTGREIGVPSDIFVPNTDGSADNVPEQKKCYDRHYRTNVYQEGNLVQIYRPVPPPGTHRKFHHPWSRDPSRVMKALSPTNYLVCNVHLRTQPITVHHNKVRPYKGPPPDGYEDEVYVLTEDRRPQVRNLNGSS
ncbi:RNA directed DNA polymerase (reverse transcriptase) [Echinococcus multilocularis]|uniref:RNA directed DNA polymerase (Reverse transcriptase) n=1 Tax=Echinococcus multilocularis TaxID=6211 RepID=A0A0S4MM54_ECHMU|nr:RNA directed DNA polymerase (reverse transcriptase) [Echinococcus multilocularis]